MPYKRRTNYIGQVRRNGNRIERVFKKKEDAKNWEAGIRMLSDEEWHKKINTVCLIDWATRYLDHSKVTNSTKTYKEKKATFKEFFKHIDPNLSVHALEPGDVLTFIEEQKKIRSGNAANKDRKNLVAAWNWGMMYLKPKLPSPNPCAVKKMPEKRKPRYVPPEQDYMIVYNFAEGQDKIMVFYTYALALRRGEVFRTKITDLDIQGDKVRIWTRKREDGTWEYDWLPIPPELKKAILWWLENRPIKDHEYLFYCLEDKPYVGINFGEQFVERKNFMNRLCKKAGVKSFGFYGLRHLRATTLYHQGKTIATIQTLLRHKNPNTTVKYLRSLGLDVMNEELRDLALQNGKSLVFEPEKMKLPKAEQIKKPSGEPSSSPVGLVSPDYTPLSACNH